VGDREGGGAGQRVGVDSRRLVAGEGGGRPRAGRGGDRSRLEQVSRDFRAHDLPYEAALSSLDLFCEAARLEAATVELARRAIAEIETARRSAPPGNGRGPGVNFFSARRWDLVKP
jgi:hypothetical protein